MSWSFSNSAATRACMFKFSAFYLQWFQSYGQQFIWLLDVKRSRGTAGALYSVHSKRSRGTAGALYSVHSKRSRGTLLQEQRRHWKASSTYTSSSFTWWFIDGTTNTFSNAHYSQTTHPNWTKPTQGASGNVRISFRNNMGSKKKLELFIKVSAWAKRLYIEPFFQFVHFCLLACLPQQKVKGYSRSSVQCTQQKVKGYTSSCCTLRPLGSIQQELCTQQKVKGYTSSSCLCWSCRSKAKAKKQPGN